MSDSGVIRLADRKRELTRRALSEAALELIAERGYDATSVADIAERAGVDAEDPTLHEAR